MEKAIIFWIYFRHKTSRSAIIGIKYLIIKWYIKITIRINKFIIVVIIIIINKWRKLIRIKIGINFRLIKLNWRRSLGIAKWIWIRNA